MLDVSIPIGLLTRDSLLGLYALGKTSSDPRIMLELILGIEDHELALQLESVMAIGRVA